MMIKGQKLVCIGGGTGLSTLLRGIKGYINAEMPGHEVIDLDNLAAVVSVADDGGSSGKLIDEFGILPPGDIRNCMVALASESELMTQLFSFRFESEGSLGGHSLGNILITALTQMNGGNFPKAIELASRVLSIRGRILPVSLDNTILCAELMDGSVVEGESSIPDRINREPIRRVFLKRRNGDENMPCKAYREAVNAILEADAIVMGPGSLYTSVMPNLALPEIALALRRSDALKIYVCNVMAEPGETDGYSVSDHVQAILDHAPINLDYVVVNSGIASEELIRQYVREELVEQFNRIKSQAQEAIDALDSPECRLEELTEIATKIADLSRSTSDLIDPSKVQVLYREEIDGPRLEGIKVIQEDLITEMEITESHGGEVIRKKVIRHDPIKLAGVLIRIVGGAV
ncbi:uridine diphosphate-N-acetylglucosamine-binding protein YvcK [Candidatus Poribacteria bacterium]|nr:uridine diphosphate-N-acetylglucosamine-binding protein YvcK [Candidatus Poribacteria bacterium]